MHIHVAHSPDPDDRMMFWPVAENLVPSEVDGRSYLFSFEEADTQALNAIASEGRADVCAVSAIHALRLIEKYQPLLMGASVGDSYGPVVVALAGGHGQRVWENQQNGARLPIHLLTPGETTTAHSVAQLVGLTFASFEVVPIVPLSRVFEQLKKCEANGQAAMALLIHEGRLTFQDHGCVKLMDIGELWTAQTGASLPLGLNVISRSLSLKARADISQIFIASCRYALEHREHYIRLAQLPEHRYQTALSSKQLRHYLDLYANETTVSILPRDKQGFDELLRRASEAHFLNLKNPIEKIDWI